MACYAVIVVEVLKLAAINTKGRLIMICLKLTIVFFFQETEKNYFHGSDLKVH